MFYSKALSKLLHLLKLLLRIVSLHSYGEYYIEKILNIKRLFNLPENMFTYTVITYWI